jgi:AmmeMemoRadiSam system protein A
MLLDNEMGIKLLKIARAAIDACLTDSDPTPDKIENSPLNQTAGCFVTIHKGAQLRGCIGNFVSTQPLYLEVAQMAVAAATADPRFHAMNRADLGNYNLDISVLSPLEKIDDIDQIEVGTHGIYLEKDYSRGVLLPQVATEQGWDRLTFLQQTCLKAGLPSDAWESAQASIYIFSAQVITEDQV